MKTLNLNLKITVLAVLAATALGCPKPSSALEPDDKLFYLVNAVKGSTTISATLRDSGQTLAIAGNVALGEVFGPTILALKEQFHTVDLTGGGYNATTPSAESRNPSVVVAMSPDSGPKAELYGIVYKDKPVLVFFKDGNVGGAGSLDIYVTPIGQDLSTVAPDGTITENAKSVTLLNSLDAGKEFEVRLTRAGTKNVVAPFGSSAGIGAGKNRFYILYHRGTTEQFIIKDFDAASTRF